MKAKQKIKPVLTCYEVGCFLANKETGTCNDKSCVAHPENLEEHKIVGRGKSEIQS